MAGSEGEGTASFSRGIFFKRCTYAGLNSTVAVLRGRISTSSLREISTAYSSETIQCEENAYSRIRMCSVDSVAHRSRHTALGTLVKSEVKVSAAARKGKLVLQATVTTAVGGGIWAE
jgi:hypothetical protein